ncbi:hypothetical protein [Corallococcus sp. AS-1-6]|uniref:hypothetical protein n=1 Tax=Corallococcus TaxID=83461 RepID=UPI001CC06AD1|nr:hypothetical protein [Corallococcus sp. AS-1-6]MBZ4371432.1 hypothetical protein [Corallococcus sp. AS-1-6]
MAAIPLANLLTLFIEGLVDQRERASPEAALRLLVEEVELQVPLFLHLVADGATAAPESSRRLLLTLPDVREAPAPRALGRLRVTLVPRSGEPTPVEEEAES